MDHIVCVWPQIHNGHNAEHLSISTNQSQPSIYNTRTIVRSMPKSVFFQIQVFGKNTIHFPSVRGLDMGVLEPDLTVLAHGSSPAHEPLT